MEFKKVKLTKDNLCKIKEVDDTFYKSDNLNLDWYLERYEDMFAKAKACRYEEETLGII